MARHREQSAGQVLSAHRGRKTAPRRRITHVEPLRRRDVEDHDRRSCHGMTRPRPDDPADSPKWWRYLRFWGANVGAEVDDEISFHLEELVGYYVARGVPPDEARRIATERFGDREHIALVMRTLANQRETAMQRTEWIDSIRRDISYAIRQ